MSSASGTNVAPDRKDIAARGVRGVISLGLRTGVFTVLGILRLSIVARFLGPREVGIFGILAATIEGARAAVNLGARALAVQRANFEGRYVATYRVFAVIEAVLMAVIVLGVAPFTGDANTRGRIIFMSALVAVAIVGTSLSNPGAIIAERTGRFEKVAIVETISTLAELVATVVLAVVFRSALALALAVLARAVIDVVLSYTMFPSGPPPAFDREAAKEFVRTGARMILVSTGSYVTVYGDNIIVAAELGAAALGLYVVAYRLSELPFKQVQAVTNRVMLQVLSRLESTPHVRTAAAAKVFEAQQLCIWPIAVGLALFGSRIVVSLYGPSFAGAGAPLRALGLLCLMRSTSTFLVPAMYAAGAYGMVARSKVLEAAVFVAAVFIGTKTGGLVGAALGAGAAYGVGAIWRIWFVARINAFGVLRTLRIFGFTAVASIIAAAASWAIVATCGFSWLVPLIYCLVCIGATLVVARPLVTWFWVQVRGAVRS